MSPVDRLSSLDDGYSVGNLSIFPEALDSKETLFEARNNAEATLAQGLPYSGQFIVVDDASAFPPKGLIRVGTESVYYDSRTATTFKGLKRGFAKSRQNQWPVGTPVAGAVMAEHHNALKDAVVNLEANLGVEAAPADGSLNGMLKALEAKFLAPRPLFAGYPQAGAAPLTVAFRNFSTGENIRYFWDFGDGAVSQDENPAHTYLADGTYTVQLSVFTRQKAQGVVTKRGYITVDANQGLSYLYADPVSGPPGAFTFVDQTAADVVSRHWDWGDGTPALDVLDPYVHAASHTYAAAGEYVVRLLVVYASGDQRLLVATVTVTP